MRKVRNIYVDDDNGNLILECESGSVVNVPFKSLPQAPAAVEEKAPDAPAPVNKGGRPKKR